MERHRDTVPAGPQNSSSAAMKRAESFEYPFLPSLVTSVGFEVSGEDRDSYPMGSRVFEGLPRPREVVERVDGLRGLVAHCPRLRGVGSRAAKARPASRGHVSGDLVADEEQSWGLGELP